MTSLYAKYINEREGKGIIEKPHGFATYSFLKDGVDHICYIEDIFVELEKRNTKYATSLAMEIEMMAKLKQCSKLMGSVCLNSYGADASIKVLQGYNMKVSHIGEGNMIYFIKELK